MEAIWAVPGWQAEGPGQPAGGSNSGAIPGGRETARAEGPAGSSLPRLQTPRPLPPEKYSP